ncbi:MAG: APC family permease [Bryobacteraceae bacterium]
MSTNPAPGSSTTASLKRVLSRRDLILYGLVILTPTAPYPVYGIVQQTSHGHAALAYLVAMVAMLFTAASYGKMSGAFPSAGSTYTYAQQALDPHIGFLAGWAMILDYFLIPLLSVVYAALTANRILPQVPYAAWAVLFTVLITLINVRGIRVTANAGNVMMALMTACAVVFVVLAARWVMIRHGIGGLIVPGVIYNPHTFGIRPLMLGAAIGSLSYIGFDAISTLAEDTIHPERDISIATVLVCLIQTVFCVVTVYLAALVWPDYNSYPESETVILDIGRVAGGPWMMGFITFILLVAGLASALTGQAGASRLLLGMGRDGVISRRIFAHVEPRFSTPVRGIYLMGAVSLVGSLLMRFQLVVELLNFGAFVGFILVNLSVIRHFYIRLRRRSILEFFTSLVFPLTGAVVCSYVWWNLSLKARIAGFCWLGLGVLYLAFITRGFRVPPKSLSSLKEAG